MKNSRLKICLLVVLLVPMVGAKDKGSTTTSKPALSITRQRCDELLAQLPADPWIATKDASTLAWNESYNLAALLDLYAATKDRKYLDELVHRADQELSHRDDARGFKDASGETHKRWSVDSKYTVAITTLTDSSGQPSIKVRSTPYAQNHVTKVRVAPTDEGFTIHVSSNAWKRDEIFPRLSMDAQSPRYFAKVINSDAPLAKPPPGKAEEQSQLIHVEAAGDHPKTPQKQGIALTPQWYAHVGYVGIIYQPLLEFAQLVKADSSLKDFASAADRFIAAAEESYAEIADHWRDGPQKDEGYYLGCVRGGPSPYDGVGEPFNYLAKHACSELLLFKLTGKPQYREHVVRIATLFKNRLQTDPAGTYVWKYWYEPVTTGWKKEDKISDHYPSHVPYDVVEDSSHGTLDIAMACALNREKIIFDDEDMRVFVKTFMKNVLNENHRGFNAGVDGSREDKQSEDTTPFGWIPLAQFDRKVYDACREVYLARGDEDFKSAARLLRWETTSK